MMDRRRSLKPNPQILEEASTWFVELSEGEVSASAREEFTAWLRGSPEHVRAFLQISELWEDAPRLGKRHSLDIDGLLAAARSGSSVVSLGANTAGRDAQGRVHPRLPRFARWGLAAGVLAATVGASIWIQWHKGMYETGIGETRWVNLPDGSTIELNAESRIRVRLTPAERDIDLLQGQALFRVTKNPARPLIVHSGIAQITDIGTEFDVYRRHADTVVTVIEGRVAVRTLPASSSTIAPLADKPPLQSMGSAVHVGAATSGLVVTQGEQVDLVPQLAPRLTRADVAAATAWTRQMLVFASAPLSEVVTQYNLYHEKRLVIQDPSLTSYHVSGVFSATDSSALVEFLRAQPMLVVQETDDEIDISSR